MKNKFLIVIFTILVSIFISSKSFSSDQFSFDVTNIEILENGNVFKGLNKGIIQTNDGIIITADSFEYNKISNILNAKGNVKIEDTIQKYFIFSDNIIYKKNQELILTQNNSRAIYRNGQTVDANNFEYNIVSNILNANGNVRVEDKIQDYLIQAQNITYNKKIEKLFTTGNTKSNIQSKYFFQSKNVEFLIS